MSTKTMSSETREARSVLVVDDDPWVTRAIVAELGSGPDIASLVAVHDGAAAVEAYAAHRPDVVLMDLNMPGMGGVDAIAAIRTRDPEARIVVLTTVAPGPGIARAVESGAMAAVNKTASAELLRAAVRSAAAGDDPALLKHLTEDIVVSGDPLPDAPECSPQLTTVERQVLALVCGGCGYEEIAVARNISVWTVKSHVRRLRAKLQAANQAQLIIRARQFNFVGW